MLFIVSASVLRENYSRKKFTLNFYGIRIGSIRIGFGPSVGLSFSLFLIFFALLKHFVFFQRLKIHFFGCKKEFYAIPSVAYVLNERRCVVQSKGGKRAGDFVGVREQKNARVRNGQQ